MTNSSIGFIDEMNKLAVGKRDFKRMKANPFSKNQVPWKRLSGWQKARVGAGIGANVAFGVIPLVAGLGYGAKKVFGSKPPVEGEA